MEIEMSHWIAPLSSVLPSAQPFVVASSILEGCFYSSLKQPANSDSSIITWIRETSIRNIHLIQGLFCAANIGATFYAAGKLVSLTGTDFYFNERLRTISMEWVGKSIAYTLVPGIIFILGRQLVSCLSSPFTESLVYPINHQETDPDTGEEVINEVEVTQSNIFFSSQSINQVIHFSQFAIDCGLILVSKNQWFYICHAITTLFNFFKNTYLRWSKFSLSIEDLELSDFKLMFGKNHNENVSACFKHMGSGFETAKALVQSASSIKYRPITHDEKYGQWKVNLEESDFPKCPFCDERSASLKYGNEKRSITITKESPPLPDIGRMPIETETDFSMLIGTIYDLITFGFGCLSLYPQLIPLSAKIQFRMISFNALPLFFNTLPLTSVLLEKIKTYYPFQDRERKKDIYLIDGVVLTAIFGLSFLLVFGLNRWMQPTISGSEWFKRMAFSEEITSGVSIDWSIPFTISLVQVLYMSRLIILVSGRVFLSKQSWFHDISIGLNLLNLINLSRLRWVRCTKSMGYPIEALKTMNVGASFFNIKEDDIKNFSIEAYFVRPMPFFPQKEQIDDFLKSSYLFIQSCFDKSNWERFWLKENINYRIYFLAEYFFQSDLFSISPSGTDTSYGPVKFHVDVH